ncbi:bifunctional diguanylate cyclase/phosphodiesterase|nr:bifunctional diguanylate cyclase/phosphodiesterase [Candidatus Pantoea persica]
MDSAGQTRYAVINGQMADMPLEAWLGTQSTVLLRDARGLQQAASITMGKVAYFPAVAGPPSVLIFVYRFTLARLEALGKTLDVWALRSGSYICR